MSISGFDPGVGGYEEEDPKPTFDPPPAEPTYDTSDYGLGAGGGAQDDGSYTPPAPDPEPTYDTSDYGLGGGGGSQDDGSYTPELPTTYSQPDYSEPEDPNYGLPASDYGTYQATQPQPQYYDEFGGNDPGQAAPAPEYVDEFGGNDPGLAAPAAQPDYYGDFGLNPGPVDTYTGGTPNTWQGQEYIDEWGGDGSTNPGDQGTFNPDHGQYDMLDWQSGWQATDTAVDGSDRFNVQSHYTDRQGNTYDWDPGARAPSLTIQAFLNGQLDMYNLTDSQLAEISEFMQDPQEGYNWWYTQQTQQQAASAYNRAQAGANYSQQYLANNSARLRQQEQYDQRYNDFTDHASERARIAGDNAHDQFMQGVGSQQALNVDNMGDGFDPTMWEGPNGRDGRSGVAANQSRAGADFDRYVSLIQNGGTGFEQATAGLTDAERLNLWSAGQAVNDPARLAQIRQQWVGAHVGSGQSYMADPTGFMSPSVADVGNAAVGAYSQGMEGVGALMQQADNQLNQIPGVKRVSDSAYQFVQQALAIPPDELKQSTGPLGTLVGSITDASHEAMIQIIGTRIVEQRQIAAGVPGTQTSVTPEERRAAGQQWAQENPEAAFIFEQLANLALTYGAGKFVPHAVTSLPGRVGEAVSNVVRRTDEGVPTRFAADLPFDPPAQTPRSTYRLTEYAPPRDLSPEMANDIRGRIQQGFADERVSYPPQQGPRDLPSQAPQVPHDISVTPPPRALPEIPGTMRGADYAAQVAENGLPERVRPGRGAFDEGELPQDLEGEMVDTPEPQQARYLRDQTNQLPRRAREDRERGIEQRRDFVDASIPERDVVDAPRYQGRVETSGGEPPYREVYGADTRVLPPDRRSGYHQPLGQETARTRGVPAGRESIGDGESVATDYRRNPQNVRYERSPQRAQFGQARTSAMPGESRVSQQQRLGEDLGETVGGLKNDRELEQWQQDQQDRVQRLLGPNREDLGPVERNHNIEAAYQNAVAELKNVKVGKKSVDLRSAMGELQRIQVYGPPVAKGEFPMVSGLRKPAYDRLQAFIKEHDLTVGPRYSLPAKEMQKLTKEERQEFGRLAVADGKWDKQARAIQAQVPPVARARFKEIQRDIRALDWEYQRTNAVKETNARWDTEPEVADQFHQYGDNHNDQFGPNRHALRNDASGADFSAPEEYDVPLIEENAAVRKRRETQALLEEHWRDEGGNVPAHMIDVHDVGPRTDRSTVPSMPERTTEYVRPQESAPQLRSGKERAEAAAKLNPTSRYEGLTGKARDNAIMEDLYGKGHVDEKTFTEHYKGDAQSAIQKITSQAVNGVKAGGFLAVTPLGVGPNVLQINDTDTEGQKLFKYSAYAVGAVASLYAISRHPRLRAKLSSKPTDLPNLTWAQKNMKILPKDTQRMRVVEATKAHLTTHIQSNVNKFNAGSMTLSDFKASMEHMFTYGGRSLPTVRQDILNQQVTNLYRSRGVGKALSLRIDEIVDGAIDFKTRHLDINRLAQNFGDELDTQLKAPDRIGKTPGRDANGNVTWASPVEKAGQIGRKAFHEVFLQHNGGWLAEQKIDGAIQRTAAKTLDQLTLEHRKGAAGAVYQLLGDEKSGWPHSSYLENTRITDIGGIDEPTILGRDWLATKIRHSAEETETYNKKAVFSHEAAGYLNTAMARELGTTTKPEWMKWIDKTSDPFIGAPKDRLAGLTAQGKKNLDGVVDRAEFLRRVTAMQRGGGLGTMKPREIMDIFDAHQADATQYGLAETRSRMRDYSQKTNLDLAFGAVYPLHYWTTHNMAFMAKMAAKHPVAALAVAGAAAFTMDQNKDLPNYAKMSIKVPVRDLANKLPADKAKAVNEAVDAIFGKGQDPRVNLWGYANPFIADVYKAIDGGDLQRLKETFGAPDTAKQIAELAVDFGYHSGPMLEAFSMFAQHAGGLPEWLDQVTTDQYQGRNFTGPLGQIVRDAGELTPLSGFLHGIYRGMTGKDFSAMDEQGIKDFGSKGAYYRAKLVQDGLYMLGMRNTTASEGNYGSDGRETAVTSETQDKQKAIKAQQAKFFKQNGPMPAKGTAEYEAWQSRWDQQVGSFDHAGYGDDPPQPKAIKTQQQVAQSGFNTREGDNPEDRGFSSDSPEVKAYWSRWRQQVLGEDPPISSLPPTERKTAQQGFSEREGVIPSDIGYAPGDKDLGIPQSPEMEAYWSRWNQQVGKTGMGGDPPSNVSSSANPLREQQLKEEFANPPGKDAPASYKSSWYAARDKAYRDAGLPTPGDSKIENPPSSYGLGAAAAAIGKMTDQNVTDINNYIGYEYNQLKTPDGKSTPESRAFYDKPLGPGGPTPTQFQARWGTNQADKNGVEHPNVPAQAYGVGNYPNGQPYSPYPGTKATAPASGASTGGASSTAKPSQTSSVKPASTAQAKPSSGSSRAVPVAAAKASTPASSRSTYAPAPKPSAYSSASSSRTTSAPKSSASVKTGTSGTRSTSLDYYDFVPATKSTIRSTGDTTVAMNPSGLSRATASGTPTLAKETATKYNDWQARADKGESDLGEAYTILENHARQGGDPTPYVKRAQYTLYQQIKAYSGPTRAAGDKDRGDWFKRTKALTPDLKGLKQMVAIQKEIKAKQAASKKKAA